MRIPPNAKLDEKNFNCRSWANYQKLKLEIVDAISAHNSSKEIVEFQKEMILGNYPQDFKENAIEWLGRQNTVKAIDILIGLATQDKEIHCRRKAIFALSQIKDSKAFDLIAALASEEKNVEVRQMAIFGSNQIGDKNSLTVLEEI